MWAAIEPIFHTLASSVELDTRELDGDLIRPYTGNPQRRKLTLNLNVRDKSAVLINAESVEFRLAI